MGKQVPVPRERTVDVPHVMTHERLVAGPQPGLVETIREVAKISHQGTKKEIRKPVVQCMVRTVDVPQTTVREQIREVPTMVQVELKKEVPVPEVQKVEKLVEKPTVEVEMVEELGPLI